jgi:hypothetical protein
MSGVLRDIGHKGVTVLALGSEVNLSSLVATSLIHEDICFYEAAYDDYDRPQ